MKRFKITLKHVSFPAVKPASGQHCALFTAPFTLKCWWMRRWFSCHKLWSMTCHFGTFKCQTPATPSTKRYKCVKNVYTSWFPACSNSWPVPISQSEVTWVQLWSKENHNEQLNYMTDLLRCVLGPFGNTVVQACLTQHLLSHEQIQPIYIRPHGSY